MTSQFRLFSARSGLLLLALLGLAGCATGGDPRDPLEPMNRGIYKFNDAADKAILKPVAQGYKAVVPKPVRSGVTNFFSNIDDVLVAVNNVLQFKFNDAMSDVGRVIANTTFGVAGVFDVATGWGMPKHNEDFGQTLGAWGVGDGPFLMLPLLGPSNVRDAAGLLVYYRLDPVVNLHNVPARNSLTALRFVDRRARLLDAEKVLDEAALDPYTFLRDAYIQQRRNLVHDGNAPAEKYDEDKDTAPAAPANKSEAPAVKPQSAADMPQVEKTASAQPSEKSAEPTPDKLISENKTSQVQAEERAILVSWLSGLFRGGNAST